MRPTVQQVDRYDPTDWEWAVCADDDSILDRFETEQDAREALPDYF